MKIAALTSGRDTPSTRFRIRQHIEPLLDFGITVNEYYPILDKNAGLPSQLQTISTKSLAPIIDTAWRSAKLVCRSPGIIGSWLADATWLSRELLPGYLTLEKLLKSPIFLDVDDAIWHAKPYGKHTCKNIALISQAVIAGNDFLADWFSNYNSNVFVIPTAIDTTRFSPQHSNNNKTANYFIIGWTGISGNFRYLYQIEDALFRFLSKYDARLLIVSELPPSFRKLDPSWVTFSKWSREIEASIISEMDVGIMPIPDSEWARGKCSFKMLQYLSCGIPCIASPVGMNKEVLDRASLGIPASDSNEYYEALRTLYLDNNLKNSMGINGRAVVKKFYSKHVVSKKISEIFYSSITTNKHA